MAKEQAGASSGKAKGAPSNGIAKFLAETREEFLKVVWPSRSQLVSESVAVILTVSLVATLIYLFDNLFVWIAGKVF